MQVVAPVVGAAMPLLIGLGLFIYYLCRYRISGFRDEECTPRYDDSAPGVLFLELAPRSGPVPDLSLELELCVRSGGRWEVVGDRDLRPVLGRIT
jgi:hypothetical protein